jgi:hypothetical protein
MEQYQDLPFHPTMEKLVTILRKKTQNEDPIFFRLVVSYFFSKIASMMRVHVHLADNQIIPVNMYAINLAPSGSGKGHSIAIIEEEVISAFRQKFLEVTFPAVAAKRLIKLANKRAIRDGTDAKDELNRAKAEFEELGNLLFSFDSGTGPALKQMRTKLLMASAGSMNLEIDEIGSNMTSNTEVLTQFLELFDTGRIKQKLIKNTRENTRAEDLTGSTPTNMLWFGTPTKLLDGSRTEDEFYAMLETGYARRCFFGFSRQRKSKKGQTAQSLYDLYHDPATNKYLMQLNDRFGLLSDPAAFHQKIKMKHDVMMAWYDYQIACQTYADTLSEYEDVRKAEISHRYFKVAKLAAVYAYIDKAIYISIDHLHNAIAMAEQSGEAFKEILNRDRPYVKLSNYICSINKELTQADLTEDLPFYKGSEQNKKEMLNLAIAHGYKQGMYITSTMIDGIQFLSGKKAQETNLDEMIFAYSKKYTEGYIPKKAPFNQLHRLLDTNGYHWVNHHLRDNYRDEDHAIPGANMIVLDIENSVDIKTAKFLLQDYTYLIHTTKRHTPDKHRFRVVMPLSHHVELSTRDFKEFMKNIYEWLPFTVDDQTGQRSRKWMTCKGNYWYNNGELLDTLQFVPKTKKAEENKQILAGQTNLTNIERWFINNSSAGNRNNKLRNYAFMLIDMGYDGDSIRSKVMELNNKTSDPLDENEILSTIIVSVTKRLHTKEDNS